LGSAWLAVEVAFAMVKPRSPFSAFGILSAYRYQPAALTTERVCHRAYPSAAARAAPLFSRLRLYDHHLSRLIEKPVLMPIPRQEQGQSLSDQPSTLSQLYC
jgi:hypothetical protein